MGCEILSADQRSSTDLRQIGHQFLKTRQPEILLQPIPPWGQEPETKLVLYHIWYQALHDFPNIEDRAMHSKWLHKLPKNP